MNGDGRMDIHEFSIAMKLIKLKLQGHPLPPTLPPSMKQPPLPLPPQTGFGKTKTRQVQHVCNNCFLLVMMMFFLLRRPLENVLQSECFSLCQVCLPWHLLLQVFLHFLSHPSLSECRRRSSRLAHLPSPSPLPTELLPLAWYSQSQASPTLVTYRNKHGKVLCWGTKFSVLNLCLHYKFSYVYLLGRFLLCVCDVWSS